MLFDEVPDNVDDSEDIVLLREVDNGSKEEKEKQIWIWYA